MADHHDKKIVALIKAAPNKDEGFVLLMNHYQKPLYYHARRLVVTHENAQDVMQEAFINVYRYMDGFNEGSKLYTWLYRIVTNECIRFIKKQKHRIPHLVIANDEGPPLHAENSSHGETETMEKLHNAIRQLPDKQRMVFNLRYFDDMPYEQMSEVLDTSVGSLKTSYHYACEKLKTLLTN